MDSKSYYTDFAIKVFNLLNGVINPLNKAVYLDTTSKEYLCGCSYMYGCESIICINIDLCLFKYAGDNQIKTLILDVITHELSHLDQLIDMKRYKEDQVYKANIEDANSKNNVYFILNFKDWLEKSLGFEIDDDVMRVDTLSSDKVYVRRSVEDLIISRLSVIFTTSTIDIIRHSMNVILNCPGDRIVVKMNNAYDVYSISKLNMMIRRLRGVPISASYSISSVALELHIRKEI